MSDTQIACRDLPNCPVCASSGKDLYTGLKDTLFNAPGIWDMSKCSNEQCGTCWLNPTPLPEEIVKLYNNYFTHSTLQQQATIKKSFFTLYQKWLERLFRKNTDIKTIYQAT